MKSIMQEASSIAKAIEQGWIKAGNPTDFSVKILEEPKKNFFGLTVHPAKIALYFDEKPSQRRQHEFDRVERPVRRQQRAPEREVRESRDQQRESREPRETREPREHQAPAPHTKAPGERPQEKSPTGQYQFEPQWTEDMMNYSRQWLEYVLKSIHASQITFTIEPNNLYLRITLSNQVTESPEKEKRMLASFSLLLLETLKRHFKVGLRRHKIVLTHVR